MVKNAATEVDLETWDCIFQSKLEELQRPEQWILGLHEDEEPGLGWKQYTLHAFARFRCSTCNRWWESARVRIIFHLRPVLRPGEENLVDMRIFKQSCQVCDTGILEEPEFIIENIVVAMERLVTRMLTKCYGQDVSDRPVPAFITNDRTGGVHDTENCEACRLGLCNVQTQGPKRAVQPAMGHGSHFYEVWSSQETDTDNVRPSRQRNPARNRGNTHRGTAEARRRESSSCCPCVLL